MNQEIQSQWTFLHQNIIVVNQNRILLNVNQQSYKNQRVHISNFEESHKKMKDGSIEKYLNINKKEDYLIRISQIVRMFEIDVQSMGTSQMVSQQLNFYLNKKKQICSIQLNSSNQPLFFAQYLYTVKQIIVRVQKPFDTIQSFVDLFIFDTKGQILAIFLTCQNIVRILKSFKEKFRKIKKIFLYQKITTKQISLSLFLHFKQSLQSEIIAIYRETNQDDQNIQMHNVEVASLLFKQQRYYSFNYHSLMVVNQEERGLNQSDLKLIINVCSSQEKFLRQFFLNIQKSHPQERILLNKTSLFIRFSALYFNTYLNYKNKALDKSLLDQLHKIIIIQLMKAKKQFMQQKIQNTKNIDSHYPVQLNTHGKLCVYCRSKKSIYRCFGCTANFQKNIPLCVLCFQGYHSKQNNGSYVPKLNQKQQMHDREYLRLSQIAANNSSTVFKLATISDPLQLQKKLEFDNQGQQSSLLSYKKFIDDCNKLMATKKPKPLSIFKSLSKKLI